MNVFDPTPNHGEEINHFKVNDQSSAPGLLRVVMVDGFSASRILSVPVNKHVVVAGRNAAGKTSTIQLVPLFYGEEAGRISKKSEGKDFFSYYLPRTTSYIAFEYMHRDGYKRTVIVHASRTGDALRYRFVRSGIYEDMFVDDEGEFVEAQALANHLRTRGYQVAGKVISSVADYRDIIQGAKDVHRRGKSDDKKKVAQMVAEYALSHPSHPLKSAERVVSGMLRKDGSLKELESMVAESIVRDNASYNFSLSAEAMRKWSAHYRSYKKVMAREEDARELAAQKTRYENTIIEKHTYLDYLASILTAKKASRADLDEELEQVSKDKNTAQEAFEKGHQALGEKVFSLSMQVDDAAKKVSEIDKQYAAYLKQGVEAKQDLAAKKPALAAGKLDLEKRYQALTENLNEVKRNYENLMAEVRSDIDARKEAISQQKTDLLKRQSDEIDALREKLDADLDVYKAQLDVYLEEVRLVATQASEKLAVAREAAKNPTVDAALNEAKDAAENLVAAGTKDHRSAVQAQMAQQDVVRAAKNAVDQCENQVAKARARHTELKSKQEAIEAEIKPQSDTLLSFLRREKPDWGDDIAKTINPSLLRRNDLSPQIIEEGAGLYGLNLNLEDVDAHPSSDISELKDQLALIESKIDDQKAAIAKADAALNKAAKEKSDADRKLSELAATAETSAQRLKRQEDSYDQRKKEVAAAKATAKKEAETRVKEASEELKAANARFEEEKEKRRQLTKEREQTHKQQLSELRTSHRDAIKKIDQEVKALGEERTARLLTLEKELEKALSEKGISPADLAEITTALKSVKEQLAAIAADENLLNEWQYFMRTKYSELPEWREKVVSLKGLRDREQKILDAFVAEWEQTSKAFRDRIYKIEEAIRALKEAISTIETRLGEDASYDAKQVDFGGQNYEEVIRVLNQLKKSEKSLIDGIESQALRIQRAFTDNPNSPPADYISAELANVGGKEDRTFRVAPILKWFDTEHSGYLDTLVQEARATIGDIGGYFGDLERIDRNIKNYNSKLQKSLNKNMAFETVGEINVSITSQIRDLEFWNAFQQMAEIRDEWDTSGSLEPPEAYVGALETVADQWTAGKGAMLNLRSMIKLGGYVIENGTKRAFESNRDLANISSNGVSYLILMVIFTAFINMVRGPSPLRMVWAIDELSNIDEANTKRLLEMLSKNGVTLVTATPEVRGRVRKLFAYQLILDNKVLKYFANSEKDLVSLQWSRDLENLPLLEAEASTNEQEPTTEAETKDFDNE